MNQRFGAAALALAGHAGRMLGWRPAEFWAATPAELASALAPVSAGAAAALDRGELQRMMDKDRSDG